MHNNPETTTVAIIGGGAAGVGMSYALDEYGLTDHLVLESGTVGESFGRWNPATRFISPSFTTNGFGVPDMNAVTPSSSPAYSLESEHPSGREYQQYLQALVDHYRLPVRAHTRIAAIEPKEEGYLLTVANGHQIMARFVIMAVGDYGFPTTTEIQNAELGLHYQEVRDYQRFRATKEQVIIGGNESAFDLAINLAWRGVKARIYTLADGRDQGVADPSKRLSTYTNERYRKVADQIEILTGYRLVQIDRKGTDYQLTFADGTVVNCPHRPLLATGFSNSRNPLVAQLFALEDQRAKLTPADESTRFSDVFMAGPEVVHGPAVLCYVYKYRQRFAPLAATILRRLGREIDPMVTARYQDNNMYLVDLTKCGVDCDC